MPKKFKLLLNLGFSAYLICLFIMEIRTLELPKTLSLSPYDRQLFFIQKTFDACPKTTYNEKDYFLFLDELKTYTTLNTPYYFFMSSDSPYYHYCSTEYVHYRLSPALSYLHKEYVPNRKTVFIYFKWTPPSPQLPLIPSKVSENTFISREE